MEQNNLNKHFYAVIMAGGGGTRLWPLSRKKNPKQMLRIGSDDSLFQLAIKRLDGVFPNDRIFVVTTRDQYQALNEQYSGIPEENYILEPLPRGTASVVGLAAIALKKKDPDAIMAVLTADHVIANVRTFQKILLKANEVAKDGHLVTLGIDPTYPSTGYGYIKCGKANNTYKDFEIYNVEQFIEKPDLENAKKMLLTGRYNWNSGMFIWQVEQILNEFHKQMPDLAKKLDAIYSSWTKDEGQSVLESVWPTIEPETIDYGIMENAADVAVIEARDLGWNDVGSWDSVFDVIKPDENGNVNMGATHISVDSSSTLVHSHSKEKLVATIGVENIIVIDTEDALLISSREGAQKVKKIVELLKMDKQKNNYL